MPFIENSLKSHKKGGRKPNRERERVCVLGRKEKPNWVRYWGLAWVSNFGICDNVATG